MPFISNLQSRYDRLTGIIASTPAWYYLSDWITPGLMVPVVSLPELLYCHDLQCALILAIRGANFSARHVLIYGSWEKGGIFSSDGFDYPGSVFCWRVTNKLTKDAVKVRRRSETQLTSYLTDAHVLVV